MWILKRCLSNLESFVWIDEPIVVSLIVDSKLISLIFLLGRSVHYMSSQYLADSSLSEDVSQYDFSTPIQVNYFRNGIYFFLDVFANNSLFSLLSSSLFSNLRYRKELLFPKAYLKILFLWKLLGATDFLHSFLIRKIPSFSEEGQFHSLPPSIPVNEAHKG